MVSIIGETLAGGEEYPDCGIRDLWHQKHSGTFCTEPQDRGRSSDFGAEVTSAQGGGSAEACGERGCELGNVTRPTAAPGAANRLGMDFSRLLCDDGASVSCRDGTGKSQVSRGIDGWAATGLNAASRIWQGDRATTWSILLNGQWVHKRSSLWLDASEIYREAIQPHDRNNLGWKLAPSLRHLDTSCAQYSGVHLRRGDFSINLFRSQISAAGVDGTAREYPQRPLPLLSRLAAAVRVPSLTLSSTEAGARTPAIP